MAQSLYKACRNVIKEMASSTQNIGGYNIPIEYYTQDTLDNGTYTLGNTTQNSIVLLCGDQISIPSGKTLTTTAAKKSLVIMCNTFINNGTISMTAKAPDVLPHDYLIYSVSDGYLIGTNSITGETEQYTDNILIPAYANNRVGGYKSSNSVAVLGLKGANGTNRNCGSGGTGCAYNYNHASGSGYAFGGGAGSAGNSEDSSSSWTTALMQNVDTTYPMHGGTPGTTIYSGYNNSIGGVGNPAGKGSKTQNTGCGGRIIIYCSNFTNNGTIITNGTTGVNTDYYVGGSSGAGAIDVFYTTLSAKGTTTANGGSTVVSSKNSARHGGAGGNGSITFSPWTHQKVIESAIKYFSTANIAYLLTQFTERINNSHIGE